MATNPVTKTEVELAMLRLHHKDRALRAYRHSIDARASAHTVKVWRKTKEWHEAALRTLENCTPKVDAP